MRPEHITKIVQTYETRKVEEKYSAIATIERIKENDWNLNIPRYVDSFEAEEEIDLAALSAQLIDLDKESVGIDREIGVFCKELGIELPFSDSGR